MKKIILACLLLSFITVNVFAVESDKLGDVGAQIPNVRVFDGFGFDTYTNGVNTMEGLVTSEINQVVAQDKSNNYKQPYTIVGHSEGGLRVLAYATMLEKMAKTETDPAKKAQYQDAFNRLNAVITVSGVDRGLKALENDGKTLISKIESDVDILVKGLGVVQDYWLVDTIAEVTNFYGLLNDFIDEKLSYDGAFKVSKNMDPEDVRNFLLNLLPQEFRYIKPAFEQRTLQNMTEICDMVPESQFIKENVAEKVSYTYKKADGTKKVWDWYYKKVLGVKIYYYGYKTETNYVTATANYIDTKFSDNIPVGYIVGLNADTLTLLEDTNNMEGLKDSVDNVAKYTNIACKVVEGIHVARCVTLWGLFTGSINKINKLNDMEDWISDYQGEINDILGSSKNDGLVAEESQFYPRTNYRYDLGKEVNVHTKVVGITDNENYVSFPTYNHFTIGPYENTAIIRLEKKGLLPNYSTSNYINNDDIFATIVEMQVKASKIR